MTILKSKEFVLRPPREGDLEQWFNGYQDKGNERNFMHVPKSIEDAREELLGNPEDSETFVIDVNGKVVGSVNVHKIIKNHKALICYWVAREYRNHGIATESVKLMTDYAFRKYKLKRVQGNVRTFNKASAKVLEKAGYSIEGIMRKNKMKNGKYMDDMIFAKVR